MNFTMSVCSSFSSDESIDENSNIDIISISSTESSRDDSIIEVYHHSTPDLINNIITFNDIRSVIFFLNFKFEILKICISSFF